MKHSAFQRITIVLILLVIMILLVFILSRVDYNFFLTFKTLIILIFVLMAISLVIDSTIYHYYNSRNLAVFILKTLVSTFTVPFSQFLIVFNTSEQYLNKVD